MKKEFITNTGETVTFGDTVSWKEETVEDNFYSIAHYTVTLTEDNVEDLVEDGILKFKEEEKPKEPDYLNDAMTAVRVKLGGAFENLIMEYPSAANLILLRELSSIFNKKVDIDIHDCEYCYGINALNGNILAIATDKVKHWDLFAPFIRKEDAETAKRLLKL